MRCCCSLKRWENLVVMRLVLRRRHHTLQQYYSTYLLAYRIRSHCFRIRCLTRVLVIAAQIILSHFFPVSAPVSYSALDQVHVFRLEKANL